MAKSKRHAGGGRKQVPSTAPPKGNGADRNTIAVLEVSQIGMRADERGNVLIQLAPHPGLFAVPAQAAETMAAQLTRQAAAARAKDKRIIIVGGGGG